MRGCGEGGAKKHTREQADICMPLKIFQLFDVVREMYFQLSVQRYVPWRYHLLCVGVTEEIWHNRTKIQTGCSYGQFLVTDTRANMDGLLLTS